MVRPGRDRLSGTVQVDETYIGGPRPGKRGRGAGGKTLVAVAVEDKGGHVGRIRLPRVANAPGNSLARRGLSRIVDVLPSMVARSGWILVTCFA